MNQEEDRTKCIACDNWIYHDDPWFSSKDFGETDGCQECEDSIRADMADKDCWDDYNQPHRYYRLIPL